MTESRYRQLAPLFRVPAFRSVFYYRVSRSEDVWARRVVGLTRWAYPGPPALSIECDNIGGGLFINHGYSTIVACDSIGEDCEIAHNVTIGWNDDGQLRGPIIGDRVTIYTGAVVAGAITIGHDVKIAANAVVLRDVPAQTTIGGVPGRPLQRSRIRDPRH
jgi:serine O-acetyltransferase